MSYARPDALGMLFVYPTPNIFLTDHLERGGLKQFHFFYREVPLVR
jgi:hypothetical protein